MITLTPITEVHATRLAERDAQIASLTAENERLRALVKDAYIEGWCIADWVDEDQITSWMESNARADLQPKEGEG